MLENNCSGLILAGGRGQRMQTHANQHTEKCLQLLNKQPLAAIAQANIPSHIKDVFVSANTNQQAYSTYTKAGGQVLADADCYPSYSGPLAGIATALEQIKTDWLYVLPADVVFTPDDLFEQLKQTVIENNRMLAFAEFKGRTHPLFMLLNKKLLTNLHDYLMQGQRRVQYWVKQNGIACDVQANKSFLLDDQQDLDSSLFLNINTPDDLHQAHKKIITSA